MSITKTESQNAATTPTRCMHSHCLPQAHLNDLELTGDVCISVSRCGKCFWDGGHVQQSVRRMAKHTQEVSKVSNTSPNPRICSFLKIAIPWFTIDGAVHTHQCRRRLHILYYFVFVCMVFVFHRQRCVNKYTVL